MSELNPLKPADADTGFSESWLTLREPVDHAARNATLNNQLITWFKQQSSRQILELGAGTGSNLRYLMPQLGHHQHWLMLDNDATLFARLPIILQTWAVANKATIVQNNDAWLIKHEDFSATVKCKVIDLATHLEQALSDNIQLLTASALLDLTSGPWLEKIATMVSEQQCACLFALNYDGKIQWYPELETDKHVCTLLNEHQLNDKGFGNALGPTAGRHFMQALRQHGRMVFSDDSDWIIEPESRELQAAIIDGWAKAALEQDSSAGDAIAIWHAMRMQKINAMKSRLTVGHHDVLSLP